MSQIVKLTKATVINPRATPNKANPVVHLFLAKDPTYKKAAKDEGKLEYKRILQPTHAIEKLYDIGFPVIYGDLEIDVG